MSYMGSIKPYTQTGPWSRCLSVVCLILTKPRKGFTKENNNKMSPSVTQVQIESHVFPPTVKPPGTVKSFFLGGAGERGLEIQGKFIKFTAIGVYLEDSAIPSLAVKWKGKSAEELTDSVEFFRDIVSGN
ncbi:hypothetical protein CsSME_00028253 [Camellia sinensis var. sinensis]